MRAFILCLIIACSPGVFGEEIAPVKGDLNEDGVVDAVDAVLLVNLQAGNLATLYAAGDFYQVDRIAGVLRFVPAGTFTQGSPADEPCRQSDETQFSHTLTRNLAVMETEVTRQMWADLLAAQPTLPADPTDTTYGAGMSNPVQNNTWYEAVLFANLLSFQQGLTRCYYTDAGFTTPIDATNYTAGNYHCDFAATGYRLLTEGEWEYCCRAGTTTPFWIAEPNYNSGNCSSCTSGLFPNLESVAVFCANEPGSTVEVATKLSNPVGACMTPTATCLSGAGIGMTHTRRGAQPTIRERDRAPPGCEPRQRLERPHLGLPVGLSVQAHPRLPQLQPGASAWPGRWSEDKIFRPLRADSAFPLTGRPGPARRWVGRATEWMGPIAGRSNFQFYLSLLFW